MRTTSALAAVILLGAAATAHGDDTEDEGLRGIRMEVGVGFLGGGYGLGGIHDRTSGVAVHGGWRHRALMIYGELDGLSTGGEDLTEGVLHRAGINARYDLGTFGSQLSSSFWGGGILWGEVGAGWEHFRYDTGRSVDRPDLAFGIGAQYTLRFGGDHRPRLVGIYLAAKVLVADAPQRADVMSLCRGDCTAIEPTGRDLGILFNFGLTFGR